MKADGHTVLLTTHYIDEAEALCDRVAVIHKGTIVASGATRELMGRSSALPGCSSPPPGRWSPRRWRRSPAPATWCEGQTARFHTADTNRAIAQLVEALSERGIDITELHVQRRRSKMSSSSSPAPTRTRRTRSDGRLPPPVPRQPEPALPEPDGAHLQLSVPTIFLIAFWVLYRYDRVPLARHMGELLTVTALGGACFGLPTTMVSERERGVWRRYRLAPVRTGTLLASTVAARYVLLVLAGLLQVALAMAIGMPLPNHPLDLWIAFSFVAFALLGLGLVIATLADNVPAVQALGQCIFLPMLIIGGVAVQLSSLPAGRSTCRVLPATRSRPCRRR